MTELRIHFEGDAALRMGFHAFFGELREVANGKGIAVKFVAAGGQPGRYFAKALRAHPQALNVLLLDSEEAESPNLLRRRGLAALPPDDIYWMVQTMEAWFLADAEALSDYYGQGFILNALPTNPNVEQLAKADVNTALQRATRATKKQQYHKTGHAPDILRAIRPEKVRDAAPNCDRFFREVLAKLDA